MELNRNNSMIHDENLKREDNAKNLALKERWNLEFQKATENINKLETVLHRGDDYKFILRNTAGRSEVSKTVDSLKEISNQAIEIAKDVKSFELSASTIFKSS